MGAIDRRRLLRSMTAILGLRAAETATAASMAVATGGLWRWAVDYGPATDPARARACDLLVLEPDHARPIAPLRGAGSTLLGYVSLGEVEKSRPYFADLNAAGSLGPVNPDWPDARMADLRHAAWRRAVIDRIVPAILSRGYDGIFIDTMDNTEAMERRDPQANGGMVASGASLIVDLRRRYPRMKIMLNRGYGVLPAVAGSIDYVLGEAMASRWNFATKRYELLSEADWQWQASRLRNARARNEALVITTLDYWDPADVRQVRALYARERAAGFSPYVATLALDQLLPEPA